MQGLLGNEEDDDGSVSPGLFCVWHTVCHDIFLLHRLCFLYFLGSFMKGSGIFLGVSLCMCVCVRWGG